MRDRDSIHRFVFEDFPVRGELVHLDSTWQAVLDRHDYPGVVRDTLGEAMAATALLASTLKFDGTLTLQLQGDGLLEMLVVQCTSRMNVRGLARWKDTLEGQPFTELAGNGRLAITVENKDARDRYQGIVPVQGSSLAECLQGYFDQSVQLPTRLWLATSNNSAVGLLIQKLPAQVSPRHTNLDDVDTDGWPRVQALADTVTDDELLNLSGREILHRLFHEEDVRLFESSPVAFRCSCSRRRISNALRILGRDELQSLIEEQGGVKVACEFCNKNYRFDRVDAEALFVDNRPASGGRSLH